MRLLLMRHAPALPGAENDPDRALQPQARAQLLNPPEQMRVLLSAVETVVTSPWRRARDTGVALLPFCLPAASLQCSPALLPHADLADSLGQLEALAESAPLLVVAHQPLLGRLLALLCEGPGAMPLAPQPGEMAVIELDWPAAGLGTLQRWSRLMPR